MSLSLRIIFGIATYYIILGTVLGYMGLAIGHEASTLAGLSTFENYTAATDVSLANVTTFWQGLSFTVDAMPWYIDMILLYLIPLGGVLSGIWLLRGNG